MYFLLQRKVQMRKNEWMRHGTGEVGCESARTDTTSRYCH